jgi:NTP pyrophosphatase (non-canonical NTP hydrolase)
MKPSELVRLHDLSDNNRESIEEFGDFSCFCCRTVSSRDGTEVQQWVDDGKTGVCSGCGIDSLLPGKYPDEILNEMCDFWFDGSRRTRCDLAQLSAAVHHTAMKKGFWDEEPNIPEKLMLIVSELSEALEEYRNKSDLYYEVDGKPEGLGVELADALIRILDLSEWLKLDMGQIIKKKREYNETRPFMHGGKLC